MKIVGEGWNFSCKSEKIADIATRLFGAPEIVCGNIEFCGCSDVELTPKPSLLRRRNMLPERPKCKAGH